MHSLYLVRSLAGLSQPDPHSAKVIELRVRREARNDPPPPPEPPKAPVKPHAA